MITEPDPTTIEERPFKDTDDDRTDLDEVIAKNCQVHVECMDDDIYCMIIDTDKETGIYNFIYRNGQIELHRQEVYERVDCRKGNGSLDLTSL